MHRLRAFLAENLAPSQVSLVLEKFSLYRDFLLAQNALFNLTSITDPDEVEVKHFLDSLAALPYVHGSLLDVGSGAGFPAVPLQLVRGKENCLLIDSLRKRVDFLTELIARLGLSDTTSARHARIEDLPVSLQFDTVVARAVSRLPTLAEYCLPFVRVGGTFIAYKSADADAELAEAAHALCVLGGELETVVSVHIDGLDAVRKLIVIRKVKPSPPSYPRGGNKPRKSPL